MQKDYADAEPGSGKAKELEGKLKAANADVPETETDKEGRPKQKRTGPRGGKYFRTKVDGKWGEWQSDTNENLKWYLVDKLSQTVETKSSKLTEYINKVLG